MTPRENIFRVVETLKNRRKYLGWTQLKLSRLMECDEKSISAWEAHRRHPMPEKLAEWAHAVGYQVGLQIPPDQLKR